MPTGTRAILELLSRLAEEEELKVTINQTARGAVITLCTLIAGGLWLGPFGLVSGALLGSTVAIATGRDFKSIFEIIENMDPKKKELLANNVRRIMENLDVTDVVVFAGMLTGDLSLRRRIIVELANFLKEEMKMKVANSQKTTLQ